MPRKFDLKSAREAGYSDDEVLSHLVKRHDVGGKRFDIEGAISSGYTKTDIIEHLSGFEYQEKIETDRPYVPKWAEGNKTLERAYSIGKGIKDDIVRPLAEGGGATLGATKGAATGTAVAGPVGGILGGVAGGALGFAISKKSMDLIDAEINKLEGTRKKGKTIPEELVNSLYDIRAGAMYEMGGRAIPAGASRVVEKVSAPFKSKMTPEAQRLAAGAKESGITMTPADLTGSKSLGLAESVMEKIPGSADIIRDMRVKSQLEPMLKKLNSLKDSGASKESIESTGIKIHEEVTEYLERNLELHGKQLNKVRSRVLAKLGTNEALYSVGLTTKELIEVRSIAYRNRKDELYKKVGENMPPGGFETPNLNEVAEKLIEERKGLPTSLKDGKISDILDWAAKSDEIPPELAQRLEGLPDNVRNSIIADLGDEIKVKREWQTLEQFTHEMEGLMAEENPMKYLSDVKFSQTPAGRVYGMLKKAARDDMQLAAKNTPKAVEALDTANAFYGEAATMFKHKQIRKLVQADAGKVIDVAFRPNSIEEIKLLKGALGVNGFIKLRQGFMNKLVGQGSKDVFDPKAFKRNVERFGDETLEEVFGKSTVKELKKVAKEGLDLTLHKPGNTFLKSVANTDPDFIVDRIIGAPEAKLQSNTLGHNIKILKQAVGDDSVRKIGDRLFDKIMVQHQDTGLIKPESFAKMVDKYDRVLKHFYPNKKVMELRKLATIGHKLDSAEKIAGNPSGTGQTLIAWGIFRMIMNNPLTGAIVAFTPKQLAKIYKSKFGMTWLTNGFTIPTTAKKSAELFTKLSLIINDDEIRGNN